MTLRYTDVDLLYTMEPRLRQVSELNSAQAFAFAAAVEGIVDGYLAKQYSLPIGDSVPMLESIATDMTVYRLMSRRVGFTPRSEANNSAPNPWKESISLLKEIMDGTIPLVNSAGALVSPRTDVSEARSTTQDYHQTFSELDDVSWGRDPDKVDDLEDERETAAI